MRGGEAPPLREFYVTVLGWGLGIRIYRSQPCPSAPGVAIVESRLRTTELDRDPSLRSLKQAGAGLEVKREHTEVGHGAEGHSRGSARGRDPGQCSPGVRFRQTGA